MAFVRFVGSSANYINGLCTLKRLGARGQPDTWRMQASLPMGKRREPVTKERPKVRCAQVDNPFGYHLHLYPNGSRQAKGSTDPTKARLYGLIIRIFFSSATFRVVQSSSPMTQA